MTQHRKRPPFIRYELPQGLAGEPPAPSASGEHGGKGKPRPVTTMAVGEESASPPPGVVTTLALGEETARHALSEVQRGRGGRPPPQQPTHPHARFKGSP
jgi:hypothetical protein